MTNKPKKPKELTRPGPTCQECGGNVRLLTYRRGPPSIYVCAACIHEEVEERNP